MTIPGLGQLKTWAIAGLGILLSIVTVGLYRQKAIHANAKRKGVEKRAGVERDAHEELTEGLHREQQEVKRAKKKSRTGKRGHFS